MVNTTFGEQGPRKVREGPRGSKLVRKGSEAVRRGCFQVVQAQKHTPFVCGLSNHPFFKELVTSNGKKLRVHDGIHTLTVYNQDDGCSSNQDG